jgi:Fe-S oxidoreductase
MCNGNGQCRKKEGLMCPSYQATLDERDSTRARAQALRGLIHGQLDNKELFDEDFHKVMDLCIQCKGCKTECPSQVDMAKMKSEYLFHLNRHSLRDKLFAHITTLFSYATKASWLANKLSFFARFFGIAAERSMPKLASKPFSSLFQAKPQQNQPQVVLYVDSFTEFLSPQIGLAAVQLFEALGYNVIAPSWSCCGRPLISKGFLPEAKAKMAKALDLLLPYAEQGLPIVTLEPSCLSALTDDIRDMRLPKEKVTLVTSAFQPLAQFLLQHKDQLTRRLKPFTGTLLVHGHCHQKALYGMQDEIAVLKTCATNVNEIPSGCCGMAGSFGYEKEHSPISFKIAELVLFPHLRARPANTLIIASGNSCRSQIHDGLKLPALHFIEFLARQL